MFHGGLGRARAPRASRGRRAGSRSRGQIFVRGDHTEGEHWGTTDVSPYTLMIRLCHGQQSNFFGKASTRLLLVGRSREAGFFGEGFGWSGDCPSAMRSRGAAVPSQKRAAVRPVQHHLREPAPRRAPTTQATRDRNRKKSGAMVVHGRISQAIALSSRAPRSNGHYNTAGELGARIALRCGEPVTHLTTPSPCS